MGNKGQKGAIYEESTDSGEFWRCMLIESETRLRAARGIAKSETEAAIEAFEQLKSRVHPHSPPPLVSVGCGGYDEAKFSGQSKSYVERTNRTLRHMNVRWVRKTLGYSKELGMLTAFSTWEDAGDNLGWALKSLGIESSEEADERWIKRSPAMAAGLTEHIWEIEEVPTALPLPSTNT